MLVRGQSRYDVRQCSFSQRTVTEWNKLSADCVHYLVSMGRLHLAIRAVAWMAILLILI